MAWLAKTTLKKKLEVYQTVISNLTISQRMCNWYKYRQKRKTEQNRMLSFSVTTLKAQFTKELIDTLHTSSP